jgi:membrane-associated phospholipid phosphatase
MCDVRRSVGVLATVLAVAGASGTAHADASGSLPSDPATAPTNSSSMVPPVMPPRAATVSNPRYRPFQIDLVTDLAIIGAALGFGGIDELILSTGEIRPQRPVNPASLLGIDSGAITQTFDPNASVRSNIGLYAALAFAAVDPFLSALRDGPSAGLVDATLYAESLSVTFALTDLAKIAVRRPRPSAYVAQAALDKEFGPNGPSITATDQSLSFFSGHASICAATTATATYLAFTRAPGTWRPWVTLVAGTMLTTFVSVERVRAGAHFPTDVIAGSLAGAGVGIIVPHLHRRVPVGESTWFGINPVPSGIGVALSGAF